MNDPKSFLASLFDFSFSSFIVPKLIRLMYIVGLIFGGLYALSLIGIGFASGALMGLLALIFTPVIFLVMTILTRSYCELILVQFSLLQNVERIAEHLTGSTGPAPGGGGPMDGRGIVHSPSSGGGAASYTPAPAPAATPAPASTVTPSPGTQSPSASQPPATGAQGWGSDSSSGGSSGGGWQ